MILDSFRLDDRVALVTGASRGLGQSFAIALAQAGADVAVLGRSDLSETVGAVQNLGRRALAVRCDLERASVDELSRIVRDTSAQMGRLDILVNNAGTIRRGEVFDLTEDDWDAVIQTNLKSVYFLSQAAARVMKERGGGKIINIASLLSFQGGVRVSTYAAAKSGVAGITRACANEWAKHNINVNGIAPGYIATELTAALQRDSVRNQALLDRIPAGRWGAPEDLQGVIVFLASRASDYMHGAIVPVDGGWLAR